MNTPTSRAVLLLHRRDNASHEAQRLTLALREHGFDVATFSFDAFSEGGWHSIRHWISDSRIEIERQAVRHSEINLCGVGLGGALALVVAAEVPDKIDSLVLISPTLSADLLKTSRPRFLLSVESWLAEGQVRRRRRGRKLIASGAEDRTAGAIGDEISPAHLQVVRKLTRSAKDVLERVHAPTLMLHASGDAATMTDVRYVQVHIGARFLEVILESSGGSTKSGDDLDRAALKAVEFFNDAARRRALPPMASRS